MGNILKHCEVNRDIPDVINSNYGIGVKFTTNDVVYLTILDDSEKNRIIQLKIYGEELAITKVERKSDVSNNAHSMKPEAQPIGSAVGG